MQLTKFSIRRLAAVALVASAAAGAAGCSDDDDAEDEPAIDQITLTIGAVSITSLSGNPPTGTTTIPRGNHVVTVVAKTAGGVTIPLTTTEFELRITSSNNAVASYSMSTSNSLAGTLNAATAGTATLTVLMYHKLEGHDDYSVTLPITVQ